MSASTLYAGLKKIIIVKQHKKKKEHEQTASFLSLSLCIMG